LRWTFAVNHNSQAGFTLIEIGIAIFILAIGLIGILTLFPIGIDSTRRVTQDTNAAILSELAISDLKANDIVSIVGTRTAGQAYTYPDLDDPKQDKQFKDSFGTTTHARYSWQAIAKSINTTDTNLVRTQVVIFTNPPQFGTGTADFFQGITSVNNISTLPSGITSKDYIRADTGSDIFWYRIDDITGPSTLTLEGPFLGADTSTVFSTTNDIIDIYETMFAKH
jgi:type II secretory pathway pseudopilin PulG